MSETPKKSPWGKVQYCEKLYPGVYDVNTAGHGGIMVKNAVADKILSPAAQKEGFNERGFLNFEEDTQAAVVERELLDKGLWAGPPRYDNIADYEEIINHSLKLCNPEYWQAREKALAARGKSDKPSLLGQVKVNQETLQNQSDIHTTIKKEAATL